MMCKQIQLNNQIIMEDMEDIYSRSYHWEKLNKKTILVTGAYGMLASYIVTFLMYINICKKIEIKVIAQGRSKEKAKERFQNFWDNKNFIYTDVDLLSAMDQFPYDVNYIIHAAGSSNPRMYVVKPVEIMEPNVIGTYHLLEFARKQQCEGFLYFSSGDIYGKVDDAGKIYESTVGKLDPLDAHSCYSEGKRLAETMCRSYWNEFQIPVKIARIAHTYGPTMDIDSDPRVFADFIKSAIYETDIVLHSDGRSKRPFAYIADSVAAFLLLLLEGKSGDAYNVSNSKEFLSIRQLASIVSELPEKRIRVIMQERRTTDLYLNNELNVDNKLLDDKLLSLGFEWHYDACNGFLRTYKYLEALMNGRII